MNRPSTRLAILRAQLAAEARELQAYRDAMAGPTWVGAAPAPDADSLPLPPTYDQDLAEWLAEREAAFAQRVREYVGDAPGNVNAPAAKPVEQTHSVCIKAHKTSFGYEWVVGSVATFNRRSTSFPANWLSCDKDGWVSHVPTADSVCPVPVGLTYGLRLRNGVICDRRDVEKNGWELGTPGDRAPHMYDITAWSPTGTAA